MKQNIYYLNKLDMPRNGFLSIDGYWIDTSGEELGGIDSFYLSVDAVRDKGLDLMISGRTKYSQRVAFKAPWFCVEQNLAELRNFGPQQEPNQREQSAMAKKIRKEFYGVSDENDISAFLRSNVFMRGAWAARIHNETFDGIIRWMDFDQTKYARDYRLHGKVLRVVPGKGEQRECPLLDKEGKVIDSSAVPIRFMQHMVKINDEWQEKQCGACTFLGNIHSLGGEELDKHSLVDLLPMVADPNSGIIRSMGEPVYFYLNWEWKDQ